MILLGTQQLTDLRTDCAAEAARLIDKYFGKIAYEAAVVRPETIGEYTRDLPRKITSEYTLFLESQLKEIDPKGEYKILDLLNQERISRAMTQQSREDVNEAYDKAKRVTLWERLTMSNHEDVAYYKVLLKEYTEDMLNCMMSDFLDSLSH